MKNTRRFKITLGKLITALVLVIGSVLYFQTVYWGPRNWEAHFKAGIVAYNGGNFAESEREFLVALSKAENIPDKQFALRHTLNNLLEVYRIQAKYEDAEATIKRIITIDENQLGKEHPNVAASWNNLAELYRTQGKFDLARNCYNRALSILDKSLGREHPLSTLIRKRAQELLPKKASDSGPLVDSASGP